MSAEQSISRACEALKYFTTVERGEESIVVTRDDRPEWVRDLVFAAHGGMLPDNVRYLMIREALEAISEAGDTDLDEIGDEYADDVPTYDHERIAWLASHGSRYAYCDEAASEVGYGEQVRDLSIIDLIGWGIYAERREVFQSVRDSLESVR